MYIYIYKRQSPPGFYPPPPTTITITLPKLAIEIFKIFFKSLKSMESLNPVEAWTNISGKKIAIVTQKMVDDIKCLASTM